ncbi:MAG: hypothetical protein HUU27_07430 [Phycisphaerae bacterium]|nr:hypothetical protein [Phycisphaerae bacterium]
MMIRRNVIRVAPVAGLAMLMAGLAGCPSIADLPDELDVATSATEKHKAPRDSGLPSAGGRTWAAFRAIVPGESDPAATPGPYGGLLTGGLLERPPAGEQIFRVTFAEDGRPVEVSENGFFLTEIYGRRVPVGGAWSRATLPGLFFRSASYGIEIGGRFGIAIVVQVRFGGAYIGRAVLYAWGTQAAERLEGTFGYLLDFGGGPLEAALSATGDQYAFFATPVE